MGWTEQVAAQSDRRPSGAKPGHPRLLLSPIDGAPLGTYPMIDLEAARQAVALAAREAGEWGRTAITERKRRVTAAWSSFARIANFLRSSWSGR